MAHRIEVNGREFYNIIDVAVALSKCESQEEKDEYLLAIKHLDKWNRDHLIKVRDERNSLLAKLDAIAALLR